MALARALITDPKLILADEPTSSLDDANARHVARLLIDRAGVAGATLIVTTHDRRMTDCFTRRLTLDIGGEPA